MLLGKQKETKTKGTMEQKFTLLHSTLADASKKKKKKKKKKNNMNKIGVVCYQL